jgi:hypothetical protein
MRTRQRDRSSPHLRRRKWQSQSRTDFSWDFPSWITHIPTTNSILTLPLATDAFCEAVHNGSRIFRKGSIELRIRKNVSVAALHAQRCSLGSAGWRIASFHCPAEFGRYRGHSGLWQADRRADLWVYGLARISAGLWVADPGRNRAPHRLRRAPHRRGRAVRLEVHNGPISVVVFSNFSPTPCLAITSPDWGRFMEDWVERASAHQRWPSMDKQTKHEIWLLALGTILVEAPLAAMAAVIILSH